MTPAAIRAQTTAAPARPIAAAIASPGSFGGSVASAPASATPIAISFADAIQRGLRYNLGAIEAGLSSTEATAARLQALSALLPSLSARAAAVYENLSLKEIHLTLPGSPPVTGGFPFQDVRVFLSQSIYSGELKNRYHAGQAAERASALSDRDARDVVVFAVGAAYSRIVAGASRLDSARAQLDSAVEIDRQASDRVAAELAPEIDALRSHVERRTAEQRVVDARTDLDKDKLLLARLVGVSIEQAFTVDETMAYRALGAITEESARAAAFRSRSDLASAAARIDASAFELRAQQAQGRPTAGLSADYGGAGDSTGFNQVYTVSVGVSVPLYTGGRVRADVMRAESEVARRQAEYDDLKGRVAYDVRVAWLDLTAASSAVGVAEGNTQLAHQAQAQAVDRYANGVANYLEVVQAQEAVTRANDSYIASLYAFNVAKLALARAMGDSENTIKDFFDHD